MLEYDTPYKLGKKTFVYLFFSYAWWLTAIGIGLVYLAWSIYWGPLMAWTIAQLMAQKSYITYDMIAQWIFLAGISFIFVGWLRTSVMHRQYKFTLDEDSFHLRRGLFMIHETRIPYSQISDVEIERPYHFRILGLARIDIITNWRGREMANQNRTFLIPLIDHHLARDLTHHLIKHGAGNIAGEYEEGDEEYDEFDGEDDVREVLVSK